jgi:hypothetical protein
VPTSGRDERDAGREYDVVAADNGARRFPRGAMRSGFLRSVPERRVGCRIVFTRQESAARCLIRQGFLSMEGRSGVSSCYGTAFATRAFL